MSSPDVSGSTTAPGMDGAVNSTSRLGGGQAESQRSLTEVEGLRRVNVENLNPWSN